MTRTPLLRRKTGSPASWFRCQTGPEPEGAKRPAAQPAGPEDVLSQLERERMELHQVLSDANWVLRQLCPPRQLQRGTFEIASEIFAVRHLSGDFICFSESGESTTLAIGDVAGKGATAGMWVTLLAGLFHAYAAGSAGPADVLGAINRHLVLLHRATPLATMFVARLDWSHATLAYCNAGHPAALLLRFSGATEQLTAGGPILGAVRDASFQTARVAFQPGDALFAYSDGLLECRNPEGQEFGTERIVAAARASLAGSTGKMVFSMLAAAGDFAQGQPPEDDVSLMVLRDTRAVGRGGN